MYRFGPLGRFIVYERNGVHMDRAPVLKVGTCMSVFKNWFECLNVVVFGEE